MAGRFPPCDADAAFALVATPGLEVGLGALEVGLTSNGDPELATNAAGSGDVGAEVKVAGTCAGAGDTTGTRPAKAAGTTNLATGGTGATPSHSAGARGFVVGLASNQLRPRLGRGDAPIHGMHPIPIGGPTHGPIAHGAGAIPIIDPAKCTGAVGGKEGTGGGGPTNMTGVATGCPGGGEGTNLGVGPGAGCCWGSRNIAAPLA